MRMRFPLRIWLPLAIAWAVASGAANAQQGELKVVVTSKPIHALVADVMQGEGLPALLVEGVASPHTYAMRPSDAQKVSRADVFFRVSEALEPFTGRVVKALPRNVKVVTLAEAAGVKLLERRAGGAFESDAHDHKPHDQKPHGAKTGDGHSRKAHAADAAGSYDAHIWLDPDNAKAMVSAIAAALSAVRPEKASLFQANASKAGARIEALSGQLASEIAPFSGRPFIVLHDAYQYFERRFGLNAIGSILVDPDEQPSARRISELRRKVAELSAVCVFAEPNHQPKVVATVTEGTRARTAVLDPEGTLIEPGPQLYVELMQRLAREMKSCLSESR